MTHRYVALSDNEKTGYKARELKSVHVDAVGTFVKFVIHKNHVNRQNMYNQVSGFPILAQVALGLGPCLHVTFFFKKTACYCLALRQ